MHRMLGAVGLLAVHCAVATAQPVAVPVNDYPTIARADYVFG